MRIGIPHLTILPKGEMIMDNDDERDYAEESANADFILRENVSELDDAELQTMLNDTGEWLTQVSHSHADYSRKYQLFSALNAESITRAKRRHPAYRNRV
jgi:hypothetical protein